LVLTGNKIQSESWVHNKPDLTDGRAYYTLLTVQKGVKNRIKLQTKGMKENTHTHKVQNESR